MNSTTTTTTSRITARTCRYPPPIDPRPLIVIQDCRDGVVLCRVVLSNVGCGDSGSGG
eukprot:CAMPEP_0198250240 /NCGR_PEP_ID=MMETSP1447-20131203/1509_1 /TAXON_ID=420782 /ORGANISM="Chaetoceros dichaeta, Strain CCMP1751" /LENGTH=57 /DNA_ID=CAMNT_0043935047 /DNA_START=313 /DNA_END=482 /DNA_ORIENTATION=+